MDISRTPGNIKFGLSRLGSVKNRKKLRLPCKLSRKFYARVKLHKVEIVLNESIAQNPPPQYLNNKA